MTGSSLLKSFVFYPKELEKISVYKQHSHSGSTSLFVSPKTGCLQFTEHDRKYWTGLLAQSEPRCFSPRSNHSLTLFNATLLSQYVGLGATFSLFSWQFNKLKQLGCSWGIWMAAAQTQAFNHITSGTSLSAAFSSSSAFILKGRKRTGNFSRVTEMEIPALIANTVFFYLFFFHISSQNKTCSR